MTTELDQTVERNLSSNSFLAELYRRTTIIPFKSSNGNEYISIAMDGCTNDFLTSVERFFVNSAQFTLRIRGKDYYVEVLNGDSFTAAFTKSQGEPLAGSSA